MSGATILGNVGALMTWLWPLFVALSFATTCTQGDDDSWVTTLFFCTCITALSLPLLALSARRASCSWVRLSVPVVTVGPLLLTIGHAFTTVLGTHHLCGSGFDYMLEYGNSTWLARWYYPVMWGFAAALSTSALWPWLSRRREQEGSGARAI